MAMAGWDTEAMLNGINGVMQLAAASGEDLASTSDIVTDAMTAFGLSADQSTRFADVLAQTANRSNTSVALMGETFKYVALLPVRWDTALRTLLLPSALWPTLVSRVHRLVHP